MNMWQAGVADLILGVQCAGCAAPGISWCRECEQRVIPEPFEVMTDVWAAGRWDGRLRSAILAWKLGQATNLDRILGWHLAAAVIALDPPESSLLIPVPTTWRSRRERGRHLVLSICREAADLLTEVDVDVLVEPLVKLCRQTQDQSALSARARSGNVRGAMTLSRAPSRPVILADDIVTTGSTMSEMRRVFIESRHDVVGCVSVAASTRHGPVIE